MEVDDQDPGTSWQGHVRPRRPRSPHEEETYRNLLAAVVESSDDAIATKTLQGVVTSWNAGAERIFGYTAQEMIGQNITRLFPADRLDEEPLMMARIHAGQRVEHFETKRVRKDGKVIDISVTLSPLFNREGVVVGASKIARDITALKKSQAESALLSAVVESSSDGICTKDLEGRITSWNPGCETLFGYTAEEIMGRPMDLLFPPDRRHEVSFILEATRRGQTIQHKETQRLRKDGSLIDVSITTSPLRTPEGIIVGISEVAQDITERRLRVEAERDRAEAQIESLRQMEAFRSRFVNSAAHELANPLTPMAIQLKLLRRLVTDPSGSRSVAILERNFARVSRGIRDLLDAARIEGKRLVIDPRPVRLRNLLVEAAESFGPAASSEGVTLTIGPAPDVPIEVDEGRVMQVLYNLLSNAVKFTRHGGTVHLSASVDEGNARICVQDSGIGLSGAQIDRLFKPYRQVHDPKLSPGVGMGLGLYISRALVEAHAGRLWAESKGAGKGTTFCVELPLRQAPKQV
jgi:PAS domain S-box-containing protein